MKSIVQAFTAIVAMFSLSFAPIWVQAASVADFEKCFTLTINHDPGESLEDFPVLVRLGETISGFNYADFKIENGGDLRFITEDGTILAHEIEVWNEAGESLVWVKIPALAKGVKIYGCYGHLQPDAAPEAASVWSKYVAVVHGGDSLENAVGNAVAASAGSTAVSATADSGIVGGGVLKSSANSKGLNLYKPWKELSQTGQFSVSGWFKRDGNGGANNGTHVLAASRAGWSNGTGYLWLQEQGKYISIAANNSHQWSSGPNKLADKTWSHIAFAYDKGASLASYFDGGLDQSRTNPGNLENTNGDYWTFGSYANTASNDSFKGSMDELRIYDGVASAAWFEAEHATVADATFLSYGEVYTPGSSDPLISSPSAESGYTDVTLTSTIVRLGLNSSSGSATIELATDATFTQIIRSKAFDISEAPTTISASFSSLSLDTTYFARAILVNDLNETCVSGTTSFSTIPPGPVFTVDVDIAHIAPKASLTFTSAGFADKVARIKVDVSTTGNFSSPAASKTLSVDISDMPGTIADVIPTALPTSSPLYLRFTAVNSEGYETSWEETITTTPDGNNVWSGLSENIADNEAYAFVGGLPAPDKTLYFTTPGGLSPVINEATTMPSLRFTNGATEDIDTTRYGGYHSCGYDFTGTGLLTFNAEEPILSGTRGTNIVRNPILFNRANNQSVLLNSGNGRLEILGEMKLPVGVSNTTMSATSFWGNGGGKMHFGGPSPDFMGQLTLASDLTLCLDNPNAMTNVSRIFFGGGWGSTTYLMNNTGAPMVFPRCETMANETGWSSTRVNYTGAPFVFPVGTLKWGPRDWSGSRIDADLVVKDLVVVKNWSNGSAGLDKGGNGTLIVTDTTSWDANNCVHVIRLCGGCFYAQQASGLPPSGEFYVPDNSGYQGTLGLGGDYTPMLDGSSTPRVFQDQSNASWGFTGFGGDRTVCWNADSSLNLTNTTSGNVSIKLTDTTSVNVYGKTYDTYYAYPACFVFGNRSQFADGTILFQNPIRYELGQNWDTSTFFESTNHVVAARLRGSLRLGNRDKTWNFSGRNFGGYLALEAENTDFTGKVNVCEKGNLLVNAPLVARSVTVQRGSGLGGTGNVETTDGVAIKNGGALFGGEWDKGGTLTLNGNVTFENGSAIRAAFGKREDSAGCVKLAPGSILTLGSPLYIDVDTDPNVSSYKGKSCKILDWSEASFASGAAPTRNDFTPRPESNSDIRKILFSVQPDGLYVNYISVRYPTPSVLILR